MTDRSEEFTRRGMRLVTDRDPCDENDNHSIKVGRVELTGEGLVLIGDAIPNEEPVELTDAPVIELDEDNLHRRSYRCTWVTPDLVPMQYRTDTILGYDSFAATAAMAAAMANEGEIVVGLTSL